MGRNQGLYICVTAIKSAGLEHSHNPESVCESRSWLKPPHPWKKTVFKALCRQLCECASRLSQGQQQSRNLGERVLSQVLFASFFICAVTQQQGSWLWPTKKGINSILETDGMTVLCVGKTDGMIVLCAHWPSRRRYIFSKPRVTTLLEKRLEDKMTCYIRNIRTVYWKP